MARGTHTYRDLVPTLAWLSVMPTLLLASGCLDIPGCHCDAQSTLHCQTSDQAGLRTVAERLSASPRPRLADLVVRGVPTLPGGLFRGAALHGLLLSGSHAETLPDDLLAGLEDSLLALGLGENRLTDVPTAALRPVRRLERLDLSGNRLKALPADSLPPLESLAELNLADNQIERVSAGVFSALPALTTLSLEGNRLNADSMSGGALRGLEGLQQLQLARNRFSGALTSELFSGLPNLTKLTLSQNNFTSIEPGALMNLANLRELDLSQNQIDVIGDRSFSNLARLSTLRLDMNHIVTLPSGGFKGLKSLTSLDLSHNFLQSVATEALTVLANLRELFLRDNDIISLDGQLFDSLVALKRLDLSENPLHCDCRLASLATYLAASKTQLSDEDLAQVTCTTPSHLENAPLAHVSRDQLTCEEVVQYDDPEPRPGDASHQIRLETAQLSEGGDGAQLRWRVDPTLVPYQCDQVFVFEIRAGLEELVASVRADGCDQKPADPTRLETAVHWPQLRVNQPYRFCLVLVELSPTVAAAALQTSCSDPVSLHDDQTPQPPSPTSGDGEDTNVTATPSELPEPELAAFYANVTSSGRVTVFLRVRHAPADCAVTVQLRDADGVTLASQPMACSLPLLALSTAGRPNASVCVSAPHRSGAPPPTASPGSSTAEQPQSLAAEQCVRLRRPASGAAWWQTPAAAVALGCLLAVLLVGTAVGVYCRLHGRCRLQLGRRYSKWAGRPGVGFVRTASQPRSPSEENINKDQEETDSQV